MRGGVQGESRDALVAACWARRESHTNEMGLVTLALVFVVVSCPFTFRSD